MTRSVADCLGSASLEFAYVCGHSESLATKTSAESKVERSAGAASGLPSPSRALISGRF